MLVAGTIRKERYTQVNEQWEAEPGRRHKAWDGAHSTIESSGH